MSVLRLGIIGGGHLGRIHAKLAASSDQFDVVSVADPSEAARQTVRESIDLPTTADYRELIGNVDAAVVAAPTQYHYEITSTLLRAGIHCLVEKPLAMSPDQAQRLVQIAKSHSRVLQVGHVERFNPVWTTAQPQIGTPKFIEAMRAGPYSGRSTDIGVVLDLMIHDLDLILSLDRSPVRSVQATGIAVLGSHEDIAEARIEFESGCVATLRASRIAQEATRRMQVYSARGYADLNFSSDEVQWISPSEEVILRAIALDELPAAERNEAKERVYQDLLTPNSENVPRRNAILDEQNDFALSIESGCSPSVPGEDGARAIDVASQILTAIDQHAWDGLSSKPWRVGPLATETPQVIPMRADDSKTSTEAEPNRIRRAG